MGCKGSRVQISASRPTSSPCKSSVCVLSPFWRESFLFPLGGQRRELVRRTRVALRVYRIGISALGNLSCEALSRGDAEKGDSLLKLCLSPRARRFHSIHSNCHSGVLMSKLNTEGTGMWCPSCKTIRRCRAGKPKTRGESSHQQLYRGDYPDVCFFRRARVCLSCGHRWHTTEVSESVLDELAQLRNSIALVQQLVLSSVENANAAAESLGKAKTSLALINLLNPRRDAEESHQPSHGQLAGAAPNA
jgi:hypothetical protein